MDYDIGLEATKLAAAMEGKALSDRAGMIAYAMVRLARAQRKAIARAIEERINARKSWAAEIRSEARLLAVAVEKGEIP